MDLETFLESKLQTITKAGRYRELLTQTSVDGVKRVTNDNKEITQFSSNDYLGLSKDARLIEAGYKASKIYGVGSTGSRLITGTSPLHKLLEDELASFKGVEKALFFSTGYAANLGAISSLVGPQDIVFSDELNHSSILSGIKLSGAKLVEFAHLDLQDLQTNLLAYRSQSRNALLVSDSIFSMDGDIANLNKLASLAEKFDCWLMIDEAHSTGVYGQAGKGLVHEVGLQSKNLIQMGTCSKAFGVEGGYIAGSKRLIDFLINRAKTFIYSTAPSPMIAGALMESLKIVSSEDWRREKLFANAQRIKSFCKKEGFKLISEDSHIICLEAPNNETALNWSKQLFAEGFWVQAIRAPTVKTPRLRITTSSLHESKHLNKLFEALKLLQKL
jgi:8-amino-7-oxononanoate synthase